ncbi:hypothetical protein PVAP13_3KG072427 [Panicum virgatum]|uniref:Uncharacterized protein n=1 Tax=Panicum virgatum TaxID=38727 RepID=A0A8T0URT5_PANVG|nr:hypothetical protein PVAP13_3KG072427 [Panicum virgatum]
MNQTNTAQIVFKRVRKNQSVDWTYSTKQFMTIKVSRENLKVHIQLNYQAHKVPKTLLFQLGISWHPPSAVLSRVAVLELHHQDSRSKAGVHHYHNSTLQHLSMNPNIKLQQPQHKVQLPK